MRGRHRRRSALGHLLLRAHGILFRRELVQKIGALRNIHSTDYDFLVRAARWGSFHVSHEPCAMFMHHPGRSWGHIDSQKIFHEFFPMALDMLRGDDLPQDVRASAWAIMNQYGLVVGKYLFLAHIINHQPRCALEISNYLRRFTGNSLSALKLTVIAKLATAFPFVSRIIKQRITRSSFRQNRRQQLCQRKYSQWIAYANQLTLDMC